MQDIYNAPTTPCEIGAHVLCCSECRCSCHDDAS
jgi:hypothetical protein